MHTEDTSAAEQANHKHRCQGSLAKQTMAGGAGQPTTSKHQESRLINICASSRGHIYGQISGKKRSSLADYALVMPFYALVKVCQALGREATPLHIAAQPCTNPLVQPLSTSWGVTREDRSAVRMQ
jgi:hypothetical protein